MAEFAPDEKAPFSACLGALVDPCKRAAGARNLARGLGLVTGTFGFEYREYQR